MGADAFPAGAKGASVPGQGESGAQVIEVGADASPASAKGASMPGRGESSTQVSEMGADSSPEHVTRGTGPSPDGGSTQGCPGKGIDNTAACNGKAGPRETATCTAREDMQGGAAHGAAQAKALTLQQAMPMEAPEVTTCTARGHTRGQKQ